MNQASELRSIVAGFLEVDAASIGPTTDLSGPGLATSLARAGLDAALRRRLGVKCAAVYTVRSYGELEVAVCGGDGASAEPTDRSKAAALTTVPAGASIPRPGAASLECGIDIEEIDALPEASDYWEHEFYRTSFTDAEIAYCSTQSRPREHFAVRWAAKEAVRKLGPEYLGVEYRDLEVVRQDNGAPRMLLRGSHLPVSVSLTHTGSVAVAIAVNLAPTNDLSTSDPAPALPESAARSAERSTGSSRFSRLVLPLLTAAALGVSVWALLRTIG